MKINSFYFILFIIISCKSNNREVPKELNTIWYDILYDGDSFYKKSGIFEQIPFEKNIMTFNLESGDEYEEVKEVVKTERGYRIIFKQFRFNAEFRFYWVDKKRGIAKWEYFNNDKNPAIDNYSYYTINNKKEYNKLLNSTDYYKNEKKDNSSVKKTNESIINSVKEESWKMNCNEYAYIHIDNDSLFVFPVNSNTMYINVRAKQDNNKYSLFYDSIEDLGRGVKESLDWNSFSKDSILATLERKDNYLFLNWYGFYNKSTKNRDWTSQIDFQEDSGKLKNIRLERCNLNE